MACVCKACGMVRVGVVFGVEWRVRMLMLSLSLDRVYDFMCEVEH